MIDSTQRQVQDFLGLTEPQVQAFKIIYDFIGRFAYAEYAHWNTEIKLCNIADLRMLHDGVLRDIPRNVREVLYRYGGTVEIAMAFNPHAYHSNFGAFCMELMESGRVAMSDWYAPGLVTYDKTRKYELEIQEYEFEDDGLFAQERSA